MKLIERPVKRLFAFGCSFTHYGWATWPEIVAYDLDIPFYNLGRSGAGNQYIFNMIAQANEIYHFEPDDLVMVCWSGYMREDRWFAGNWQVAGEVSSYNIYDKHFVDRYMVPEWCFMRDFAVFASTKRLLETIGCQHHLFSMSELWRPEQPHGIFDPADGQITHKLRSIYEDVLHSMLPSFSEVLWNGDVHVYKTRQQKKLWNDKYTDWHPMIEEHYRYLHSVFDQHQFKADTLAQVKHFQQQFELYIYEHIKKLQGKVFNTIELPKEEHQKLDYLFHIKQPEPKSSLLVT